MKKFKFSLQKILDIKQKNIEQEEWNLAHLLNNLNIENKKLEDLLKEIELLHLEIYNSHSKIIPVIELKEKQNYINYLQELVNNQKLTLSKIKKSIDNKREEIVKLKIEEKKWLNLKEKKYNEYVSENNRLEQIELDDIGNKLAYR